MRQWPEDVGVIALIAGPIVDQLQEADLLDLNDQAAAKSQALSLLVAGVAARKVTLVAIALSLPRSRRLMAARYRRITRARMRRQ